MLTAPGKVWSPAPEKAKVVTRELHSLATLVPGLCRQVLRESRKQEAVSEKHRELVYDEFNNLQ